MVAQNSGGSLSLGRIDIDLLVQRDVAEIVGARVSYLID